MKFHIQIAEYEENNNKVRYEDFGYFVNIESAEGVMRAAWKLPLQLYVKGEEDVRVLMETRGWREEHKKITD